MSQRAKPARVGEVLEGLANGERVERPDGTTHTVSGGIYVFDVVGRHLIGEQPFNVKAGE